MKPVTEKSFMAAVVQYGVLHKWLVYHTHDSRRSVSGFPDLLFLRGTRIVVAELKVGGNRLTAAQLVWLAAFNAAQVPAYVWTPADWAEIETVLGEQS